MKEMILKLNAPGMTSLHKAGLAGLYMTLRAFEEKQETINGLRWELEPTQVKLIWLDEKPKAAFEELIQKSFWIDGEGFIRLTGLEIDKPFNIDQKYHLYTGLLNSFLQHGKHNSKGKKQLLSANIDDEIRLINKEFEPITSFEHQSVANDFISKDGEFNESIEAAGWLYPGGGQRHVHNNTKLSEPLDFALLLLFAPVGVIYYLIRSRTKGRKARLAMLVPEIHNLEIYVLAKKAVSPHGVFELTASSASDAVLRMLTSINTKSTSNDFAQLAGQPFLCRVITFGIVDWSKQQKTRTHTQSVFSGRLKGLENYFLANTIFQNRWQLRNRDKAKKAQKESYVMTSTAREFIADNIAQGRAWYRDLAIFISNKEARKGLSYERKGLNEMVEKASFENESERLFIKVCHESWRRRLGKLGQRATRENASFSSLVTKESEKLRTSLARCKNAETLRETVVDFWSRGGAQELLRGSGLNQILPLFEEKNWKKARDLALLALISYKPETLEEENALTATASDEGDENE